MKTEYWTWRGNFEQLAAALTDYEAQGWQLQECYLGASCRVLLVRYLGE